IRRPTGDRPAEGGVVRGLAGKHRQLSATDNNGASNSMLAPSGSRLLWVYARNDGCGRARRIVGPRKGRAPKFRGGHWALKGRREQTRLKPELLLRFLYRTLCIHQDGDLLTALGGLGCPLAGAVLFEAGDVAVAAGLNLGLHRALAHRAGTPGRGGGRA